MSRKQRRGFGPPGAKPAFGIAADAANSPAALFNAAVAHHQTGALIEAERQYRQILTLVPNHADSLHNLGLIALQRGDAAAAVELFDKAITINEHSCRISLQCRVGVARAQPQRSRGDASGARGGAALQITRWRISISAMCAASRADWPMRWRVTSARSRSARIWPWPASTWPTSCPSKAGRTPRSRNTIRCWRSIRTMPRPTAISAPR